MCAVFLPEPVSLADVGVTTHGVVLIRDPHDQDDVERCGRVVEKLRHYRLHSCDSQLFTLLVFNIFSWAKSLIRVQFGATVCINDKDDWYNWAIPLSFSLGCAKNSVHKTIHSLALASE